MERLPEDVLDHFLKGEHVMRHKPGLWNGMWSDMFIETTFMRYGHGPGGLIGITLNPSALKRWALSLHICSRLIKDVSEMGKESEEHQVTKHKEEMKARKLSDAIDRENLRKKIEACIDPLNPEGHPAGITSITSGRISSDKVNADDAVSKGKKQMIDYEASWPEGFYATLSTKVVTMMADKKRLQIGDAYTFDTELIFSRVMGLMASRDVNVKDIFRYELSPVPTSMFEDNGDMRIIKSKSVLKRKLQVEQSARVITKPEAIIMDGCAILGVIAWPSRGTVQDYIDNFMKHVLGKLDECRVHLIFDRYFEYSIKSNTRGFRAGQEVSRRHKLSPNTVLPSQQVVLNVTDNKVQLIQMICEQLIQKVQQIQRSDTSNLHSLVLTGPTNIPQEVCLGVVIERRDIATSHEEADVIIVQQAVELASQGLKCIKVICDDTDVFVLLMYYYHSCKLSCQLLMDACSSSNRTVIDIGTTTKKHSNVVSNILAAHALTGCDSVAYCFGIGKATVFNVLNKGLKLEPFGNLDGDIKDVISAATAFVATCYGSTVQGNMSDVRYDVWLKRTSKTKLTAKPNLKSLPPTTEAFEENVKRAHIQACIWKSALSQDPPDKDPCTYGWSKDELTKSLLPVSTPSDVPAAPTDILKLIRCGCSTDEPCSSGRCRCATARLPCTVFCNCDKAGNCCNPLTKEAKDPDEEESNKEPQEEHAGE